VTRILAEGAEDDGMDSPGGVAGAGSCSVTTGP
jgi:hypothetical protein